MNNTDWKILIYLREERSINKVAKRLFMTQPSLTYRLSQMERKSVVRFLSAPIKECTSPMREHGSFPLRKKNSSSTRT